MKYVIVYLPTGETVKRCFAKCPITFDSREEAISIINTSVMKYGPGNDGSLVYISIIPVPYSVHKVPNYLCDILEVDD